MVSIVTSMSHQATDTISAVHTGSARLQLLHVTVKQPYHDINVMFPFVMWHCTSFHVVFPACTPTAHMFIMS